MAVVTLTYTVPVHVLVDMEEGAVSRVVLLDEDIQIDANQDTQDVMPVLIAEGDEPWPSWDFGY